MALGDSSPSSHGRPEAGRLPGVLAEARPLPQWLPPLLPHPCGCVENPAGVSGCQESSHLQVLVTGGSNRRETPESRAPGLLRPALRPGAASSGCLLGTLTTTPEQADPTEPQSLWKEGCQPPKLRREAGTGVWTLRLVPNLTLDLVMADGLT